MTIATLKVGSKGPAVLRWEQFLRGQDLLVEREVDENYTQATADATWKFQERHGLYVDGLAGNGTIGYAIEQLGFEYKPSTSTGQPFPKPRGAKPLGFADRQALLGHIKFVSAPVKGNPEAVKITNNWQKENLGAIVIPQLKGVRGAPSSGRIFFHKKGIDQLKGLFQDWEDAGLIDRVLTWGGSWNPRFIRGSRSVLSNHAHASAFDINVAWNGLGRTPAPVGAQGSVLELVEAAWNRGFYFGGWFSSRPDAMHFELNKLL